MDELFINTKPQLNEDIIRSFENYFLIHLPESFINYLMQVNGGHAIKNIFLNSDKQQGFVTHHWYGIRSDQYFSLLSQMNDKGIRYPNNFISICDDTFGNKILLSVKGPDYGKIYFWDHEMETEPADYSNLTLIADSFDEFINNLKSEDEIELDQ